MVGYQYFNESVYYAGQENYQQAIPTIQKALLFLNDDTYEETLLGYIVNAFLKAKQLSLQQAKLIGALTQHFDDQFNAENLLVDVYQIIEKSMKEKKDEPLNIFIGWVVEHSYYSAFTSGVQFIYHYEIGRLAFNQENYEKAEEHIGKAVSFRAEQEGIELLASSIILNMRSKIINLTVHSYDDIMVDLERKLQEYPVLNKSAAFLSVQANVMLEQCIYLFTYQNGKGGENIKKKFENHMMDFTETILDHNLVGKAYSSMAVYYYRRGEVSKAKHHLKKGLEFAPNNFDLIRRLDMIK